VLQTEAHVISNLEIMNGIGNKPKKSYRVVFLTEQVMHHPPVSAFYGECRERGLIICGNDQLSARFTGTSIVLIRLVLISSYQSLPRRVE
jgi:hypothetical protein